MAAVVEGDDPVAGVAERLQPARMNPVDIGRGGKTVDQQHRRAGWIAFIEKGEF